MEIQTAPVSPPQRFKLVVCGGGASAVLLLSALRQRVPLTTLDVTVIEPREQLGLGVAYSTQCSLHLLNTRARNMSATEDPDDFFNWLRTEHRRRPLNWTRNCFAPRQLFGEYLQARLAEFRSSPGIRFRWLQETADSIVVGDGGSWEVIPAKGEPVPADIVVLATGNESPRSLGSRLSIQARPFVVDDPWQPGAKEDLPREAPVLLVGTGLTSIDVTLDLLSRGHTGPIYAVSRRGLLPRRHGPVSASSDGCGSTLPGSLRDLVRHVRETIESDPRDSAWQTFVNEMRSVAPALWARWTPAERSRFLRHARPYWDVVRHRIAPQVHSRISRAIERGQLKILRGRIDSIEAASVEHRARVRVRQAAQSVDLTVARVINCTGPEMDPRRAGNTLLGSALTDSIAQRDSLGLGLAVDRHSRVIAGSGSAQPNVFALGPLARGSRWEVTAIAEIREQAGSVARHIARNLMNASDRALPLTAVGGVRHSIA